MKLPKFSRRSPDWLVAIVCLVLAYGLMQHTFKVHAQTWYIASKLWSDFAAHLPLIRSFSLGDNWPIEYPTFPGAPIRYHFLFYAVVGYLEKLGFPLALSLNLFSAVGLALLLFIIYRYARLIFGPIQAGLLALVLFLFNGSLSFLEFFKTYPLDRHFLTALVTNSRFVSFGPWDGKIVAAFWNLNIYTNQRHLGLSFGLSLLLLFPLFKRLYHRFTPTPAVTLALFLGMFCLPWLNQAAAVITLWFLGFLFLFNFKVLKPLLIPAALMILASLPGLLYYLALNGPSVTVTPGFLSASPDLLSLIRYWFFNLGLYLILLPLLFVWLDRRGRSVLLAAAGLLLLANLVQLSPDMINNHKLVNFFMLFMVVYTSGWLLALWRRWPRFRWGLIGLTGCLALSGVIDFFPIINDYYLPVADVGQNPVARWIAQSTPKDSVFLTTTYLYNPASLAGRKTYLDYGYFNWSLGYPDPARRQNLPLILSPSARSVLICRLLEAQSIDYILITPGRGDLGNLDPHQSTLVREFQPVLTAADGSQVYSTQANCLLYD
ncbi:hypothetical protein A2W24_03165 [Microgenomates group bacterium RBG_16_45_19]|nr:MAG: hypothetical protein A2W24_03165 [Microgenomates group bacterium RBG_16_45_19]